ncbi:MAG: (Fe-S)-binding protein [Desulfuromonadales bacterium]
MKKLEELHEEIEQCVKCGACRAHCPVFGAERQEGRVARGKVALASAVLEDEIDLDKKVIEDLSQCLLCGSCSAQCPNKVPTEDIVAAARRRIADQKGLSTFGKAVAAVLGRPRLMNTMAKAGGALSGLLFEKLPENSGLRLRFPIPYLDADRTLPPVAKIPFRERVPEVIDGDPEQPTVAFFTGCGINYMYPAIGEAFVEALKFLGVTIVIPKEQACCGLPAVSAGSEPTVEKLARQNLDALMSRPVDHVVTACASCNAGLGHIYAGLGEEFEALADKTEDIFVFLEKAGLADKLAALPPASKKHRVTYHDPCHLRTRGITREPRAILSALPQVDYVEMPDAGTCCGLGGTYSVYHYENSKKIGARKAQNVETSGAEIVATDCPGCIMQLQDSINHAGGNQRAVHILELLAEALPKAK